MFKRFFCFVAFTALEKKKKVNREPRAIKDCLSLRPHTYLTFTLYCDVCFRALFEHYLSRKMLHFFPEFIREIEEKTQLWNTLMTRSSNQDKKWKRKTTTQKCTKLSTVRVPCNPPTIVSNSVRNSSRKKKERIHFSLFLSLFLSLSHIRTPSFIGKLLAFLLCSDSLWSGSIHYSSVCSILISSHPWNHRKKLRAGHSEK